jgi:hypothetical protein
MTSILEQIENTFVEELCKLNIENLERLRTQPYDEDILDIFKNTYDILKNKTNDELKEILETIELTITPTQIVSSNIENPNEKHALNNESNTKDSTTESNSESIVEPIDDTTRSLIKNTAIKKTENVIVNESNMEDIRKNIIQIAINAVNLKINTLIIHNDYMKENSVPAESVGSGIYETFFQNNKGYTVHDPLGDGDCFFYVAEEALKDTDNKKTVSQLRDIVAENIDEEKFLLVDSDKMPENIKSYYDRIADIDKSIAENRTKPQHVFTKARQQELLNNIETLKKKQLTEYKEYIKTKDFWADNMAIAIIQENLNVIFILFNENPTNDNIIYCTGNAVMDNPKYILSSYTGNHFKLITHNGKKIFTKDELPQEIKNQYEIDCQNEL